MVTRATRGVSWIKAARQAFEQFPEGARRVCLRALTIAAEGEKADIGLVKDRLKSVREMLR